MPGVFPFGCKGAPDSGSFMLEAMVGIEPGSERSKTMPKPFGSGSFSNCCTAKHISSYEPLNQANNAQQPYILQQLPTPLVPVLMPVIYRLDDARSCAPVVLRLSTRSRKSSLGYP